MDTMTFASEIANSVKVAILKSGHSQNWVARKSGIAATTFDRRLNAHGASPFTVNELFAVGRVLGIAPSQFLIAAESLGEDLSVFSPEAADPAAA